MVTVSGVIDLASDLAHFHLNLVAACERAVGCDEAAVCEQLVSELREKHWNVLVGLGGRLVLVATRGLRITSAGVRERRLGMPSFQLYNPEKCLDALQIGKLMPSREEVCALQAAGVGYLVCSRHDELRRLQGAIAFLMGNHLTSLRGLHFGELNQEEISLLNQAVEISSWLSEWRVYEWADFFSQLSNAHRQGILELFVTLSRYGNWDWVVKPGASESIWGTLILWENASIAVRESVELLKRDGKLLSDLAYRTGWEMIRDSSFAFVSEGSAVAVASAMQVLHGSPQGREHAAALIRHHEALRSAHLTAKSALG